MSAVVEAREPSARYLAEAQPALVRQFELLATAPGGVGRLRELILTLAVRGRLLQQDLSDEPADKLLARIRAQKACLAAAGKVRAAKPELEIPEAEQPFKLPSGWAWTRFGDVTINRDGERVPVSSSDRDRRAKLYDYYGASGVIDRIDGYLFDKTLLLVGEDGANLLNRSTPIAFLAHGKYWVNNHAHVIDTTDPGLMRYLELFINAISLEPYVTGTAQPKMNQAKLNGIVIALPPLPEQARIVARVDELMRLCDALEAKGRLEAEQHGRLLGTLLGTLTDSSTPEELSANWQRVADHFDLLLDRPEAVDALEQTILQLAVRGLLVPQDPSEEPAPVLLARVQAEKAQLIATGKLKREKQLPVVDPEAAPFPLPSGWAWARFPELGEFGRGKSKHRPRNDPALFNPPIYPLVQTGEVARSGGTILEYHSKYSELGLAQSRLWPAGTLCITIAANIADAAVLGFDACFPDSVVGFVPASCLGGTAFFQAFLETAKTDLVKFAPATAQKNINLEVLESLLVPLPPKREMERIVARVTELRRVCANLRQRLAASQTTQSHLAEALVDSAAA